MKVAFVGATSGIGQAVARLMAARGDELYLLGRDGRALAHLGGELRARGAREVAWGLLDLSGEAGEFSRALDAADEALGGFQAVVIAAAVQADQDRLEEDRDLCRQMLAVNFTNTIQLCEAARRRLMARGGGTLAVFSSVAGERARASNVLYGATKAGLSHYLEGLDHRFRLRGLRTVAIVPGFIRTEANAWVKPPPFAGDPDAIAPAILRAIDRGRPRVFVPGIWRLVMLVIRLLPRWIMRRARF